MLNLLERLGMQGGKVGNQGLVTMDASNAETSSNDDSPASSSMIPSLDRVARRLMTGRPGGRQADHQTEQYCPAQLPQRMGQAT